MFAGDGEVYTWGWSECVPSSKLNIADDTAEPQKNDLSSDVPITTSQLPPVNHVVASSSKPTSSSGSPLRLTGGLLGGTKPTGKQTHRNLTSKTSGDDGAEEILKKRKVASSADGELPESSLTSEENPFAPPCLVNLDPGIRIRTVAAGGRHTLALSGVR